MTNQINSVAPREIPVPPSGGSWTWSETQEKWVSNDPSPVDEPAASEAAAQTANEE